MLDALGVWEELVARAQPILKIELTDSSLQTPIRTSLLGLDLSDAPSGEPTAFMVENAALRQALMKPLENARQIEWFAPDEVEAFTISEPNAEIRLRSGNVLRANLLVAADGQKSALRDMIGIKATEWKSDRKGIVATIGHELPHNGLAIQHFLPAGPFAILPLTGNRSSIVWTEEASEADRILAAGDEVFLDELRRRFGGQFGTLTLLSRPAAFPLTMTLAREFVRSRFALAGDAAHGLHWIAGQGLNHGLKDVAALAEVLSDAARLGLDIGRLNVLRRYERWRRFDSATSAFSAAFLNRLFSNDSMALRMLRSTGLRAVDRLPPLKSLFMKEAAGLTGDVPKLLRGERL
jgi:2-octaprenyl-6-methoxyphenol hydroxylase